MSTFGFGSDGVAENGDDVGPAFADGVVAAAGLAVYGAGSADAAATRAALVDAGVPAALLAKDPTLWGPDAEAEAKIRLGWVDTFRRSRELLPRLAELRAELGRPRPRGARRHGRLVARARGDHPHPRRSR